MNGWMNLRWAETRVFDCWLSGVTVRPSFRGRAPVGHLLALDNNTALQATQKDVKNQAKRCDFVSEKKNGERFYFWRKISRTLLDIKRISRLCANSRCCPGLQDKKLCSFSICSSLVWQ